MIRVDVPGLGVVEFPDGTSKTAMRMAIRDRLNPPESEGPLDAAVIAAGKAFTDLGRGAQDLFHRVTGDEEARAELAQRQATEEALYAPLKERRPLATALGEAAPYMASGGVTGAALRGAGILGGAANVGAQTAAGGLTGGAMYAPTMAERGSNALVEGALSGGGELLGRTILRMVNPGIEPAAGGKKEVADLAKQEGYITLPSTEVASDRLRQTIEGGLETTPGGAIEFDRIANMNEAIFNRTAAEAIGETGDEVTGRVLNSAEDRIGGVFDDVLSRDTEIVLDDAFLDDLVAIDEDQVKPLMLSSDDPLKNEFKKLREAFFDHSVSGKVLHSMQSRLGKAVGKIYSQERPDVERAMTLDSMREALLAAANRSLPAAEAEALREARRQYRNLKLLRGTVDTATGNVSPKKLATRLEKRDRRTFQGLSNKLARGAAFLGRTQPALQTSGTAERSYLQRLISDSLKFGGAGAGIGGAGGMAGGDPVETGMQGAGLGFLGAVAAPALAARAYLSPVMRNWLTRQTTPLQYGVTTPAMQGAVRGLLDQ